MCDAGPSRNDARYAGEIYRFYLEHHARRHGLGREMFEQVTDWLRERDRRSLIIWVLDTNQHARRFYEAIGFELADMRIRTALDALQFAREQNGPRDSRHELIHIECLSPEDLPRFKALGVTACMQPRHCAPDITGKWAMNIGPERSRYAWAFRSLKEAGATLAFASDWNVAEMDPLVGIYTALTRQGLDGRPAGGWIPEQTIDLETALRAYTIQGAWANFVEGSRGSIAVGKYADLILLADDLFALPPAKIKDTRVLLTLVGGEEVYRSPDAKL